ncbi:MAG: HAD family hydrolase [Dictyoglomaceae bacterium]|nr:HAD family hydrolase [Dictyoglomaceae bacterium]
MKKPYILLDAGGTVIFPNFEVIAEVAFKFGYSLDPTNLLKEFSYVNFYLDNLLKEDHSLYKEEIHKSILYTLERVKINKEDAEKIIMETKKRVKKGYLWTYTTSNIITGLKNLKEEGFSLSIISNSDGTVEEQIKVSGIRKYFEEVFDSGILGVEKPEPEIFQYALNALKMSPEDTIYVGDFMMIDVYGANRSGIGAFHLDPFDLYKSWFGYHVKDILDFSLEITNKNINLNDERLHPFK